MQNYIFKQSALLELTHVTLVVHFHLFFSFIPLSQKGLLLRSWISCVWTSARRGCSRLRYAAWRDCPTPTSCVCMRWWRRFAGFIWWWSTHLEESCTPGSPAEDACLIWRVNWSSLRSCLLSNTWWVHMVLTAAEFNLYSLCLNSINKRKQINIYLLNIIFLTTVNAATVYDCMLTVF